MKKLFAVFGSVGIISFAANGQILLSGGLGYSQNFDSLSNSPDGASVTWTDNTTLPGWFASPAYTAGTTGATAAALDGNNAANRTVLGPTVLTGVSLNPGDSIFLRWRDIDDSGNDHALAVDDFTLTANAVGAPEPSTAALIGLAVSGLV